MLGARPAANITWYNNSIPLQTDEKMGTEIKERSVNITEEKVVKSSRIMNRNTQKSG